MRKIYLYWCLLTSMLVICACGSTKSSLGAFNSFETEYLGSELDGSLTLRAWGEGSTRSDAVEQAMKNAVYDVVFKGITKGNNNYNQKALVLSPNARENNETYFNRFFMDGGDYRKYVNRKDEKNNSVQTMENRQVYKYGITVRVNRTALKNRLQQDSIIK